jgi:hypothetical protein
MAPGQFPKKPRETQEWRSRAAIPVFAQRLASLGSAVRRDISVLRARTLRVSLIPVRGQPFGFHRPHWQGGFGRTAAPQSGVRRGRWLPQIAPEHVQRCATSGGALPLQQQYPLCPPSRRGGSCSYAYLSRSAALGCPGTRIGFAATRGSGSVRAFGSIVPLRTALTN